MLLFILFQREMARTNISFCPLTNLTFCHCSSKYNLFFFDLTYLCLVPVNQGTVIQMLGLLWRPCNKYLWWQTLWFNCFWSEMDCMSAQSCLTLWGLWTVACWAPLCVELSQEEYWSGLSFPPPWNLSHSGIKLASPEAPAMAGRFFTEPLGKLGNK